MRTSAPLPHGWVGGWEGWSEGPVDGEGRGGAYLLVEDVAGDGVVHPAGGTLGQPRTKVG